MNKVGKILSLVFAFLGTYTLILASQQETRSLVEEVASFSCVFWLPAVLLYGLSAEPKERKETK